VKTNRLVESTKLCQDDLFVYSLEVGSLAPIATVMLPEAFALVCWRSIWVESGEPVSM